jgi:heme A synthase
MTARVIRCFLLGEAAAFLVAAAVHSGALIPGYEHREARIAEIVIALVVLVGLALTWSRPRTARRAGFAAQGFALVATAVGIFTIIIGIGPRTLPDVVYHIGIVLVLLTGIVATARSRPRSAA